MRPEHASTGEVPVPQSATSAVERRIDARANRLINHVGFPRAGRLPMEGKAEDQYDESGGGRERDRQRRVRRPRRQRLGPPMYDRKLAVRPMKAAHRSEGWATVGERNFQNAGGRAKGGERLRGAEHVDEPASDHP